MVGWFGEHWVECTVSMIHTKRLKENPFRYAAFLGDIVEDVTIGAHWNRAGQGILWVRSFPPLDLSLTYL